MFECIYILICAYVLLFSIICSMCYREAYETISCMQSYVKKLGQLGIFKLYCSIVLYD